MTQTKESPSPSWSVLTKLIVSLTTIVIAGALLVRFKSLFVPALMAFVVAYLLHPLAAWINSRTHLSWRATINLIYLIFVLTLIGLLTWGGVGLVQQIQNLIGTIQRNINQLPEFIEGLSDQVYSIGPFELDLSQYEWGPIGQQVLGYVQPALGELGNLVGTLAGSAASTIGWLFFIILLSYFFLFESGGLRNRIIQIDIPGYAEDLRRLGQELGLIWNAYLRGQMVVFISTVIVYSIVLTILGVRYSFGVALIAGFANFLPYIGPAITWVVLGLVTYFQGSAIFGLSSFWYMLIVLTVSVLIDQVYNNLVIPRIMAQNLKVHPAFVLIAAIIGASLLGVVGVILAAPLLATLQLFGSYVFRKMLDKDPWPEKVEPPPEEPRKKPWKGLFVKMRLLMKRIFKK